MHSARPKRRNVLTRVHSSIHHRSSRAPRKARGEEAVAHGAIMPFDEGDNRSSAEGALAGRPIDYVPRDFSHARSWELVSPNIRAWAEKVAGSKIRDPQTGTERYYWNCTVRRSRYQPGPGADPFTARYDLWVFGKGGLAVATGRTHDFVDRPSATKWRTERWALPIDGSEVRSAHLAAGPPNTVASGVEGSDAVSVEAATRVARFVPVRIAPWFGNLPAMTQLHVLEPFLLDNRNPQRGDLDATVEVIEGRYEERYTCYLFSPRWVSFVAAHRSVPYSSGASGTALWLRSSESAAIRVSPWAVAAWFGPVSQRGTAVKVR